MRVPDLHAFRRVIVALSDAILPDDLSSSVIVVPTRAAAETLRETLVEHSQVGHAHRPVLLTREQLYEFLHARLTTAPPRLNDFERAAIIQAAARVAARDVGELPFRIRPGLVVEILRFYDQLRRQSQQVKRFEEIIVDALGGRDTDDRGTARLVQQTRFLAQTFREYESRVRLSGACDEHALREKLILETPSRGVRHIVVTVPDWIADPAGFFVADFELLARIPGLRTLDLVSTASALASGFHERLHGWWPGLEEVDATEVVALAPRVRPLLVRPPVDESEHLWTPHRDREEELGAVARRLTIDVPAADAARVAVVFKHPLPYLYLAPDTLGAAGVPYRVFDALPLATEPTVATVDLILDAVETRFSRSALVALLGSPHLRLGVSGTPIARESIAALSRGLSDARYLGGLDRLESFAGSSKDTIAADALDAAMAVARELACLLQEAPASRQLERVASLLDRYLAPADERAPLGERERHAREAVLRIVNDLRAAHHRHDDPEWAIDDLASAIRRAIGDETFVVNSAATGVRLLDDQAARYGEFDDMTMVGLVENEWPERPRRNIFYPPALLKALGWPTEKDRRAADDGRFLDLLASSSGRVALSTFLLDDDAIVARSVQLDEVPLAGLQTVARDALAADGLPEDRLAADPPRLSGLSDEARDWALLRFDRPQVDRPEFHGAVGPRPARAWSVSALETYAGCPFKFFAQHVLKLEEEPDDEEVMDPRRQGQLIHEVFETFFKEWQAAGHREVSSSNLDLARTRFAAVVDRALEKLSEGEAALERTRLLGSAAAAGLGEAVFRMEAERLVPVVERLLEHSLRGAFTIATDAGPRVVELRGKADRVDLLADGTFRVIDYKLGWPPDRTRALQLPIYSLCAEQRLAGHRGKTWTAGEAVYLAFKGPKRVVPLFTSPAARDEVLAKAQQRLADTIDAIHRGEFPPTPDDVHRCETCGFSTVCRRDYVGDV